jgi:hypothetical protein
MRRSVLLVLAFIASIPSCGGPQETLARVTSPFTPELEPIYENGIDLVRDPRILEGQWLETWESEIDQRVANADVVALVTVPTLRTDVDLEQRRTFRLVAHVDRVLFGEGVGQEITFVVREGQPGFDSVETNERSLLNVQYLAFVKWAADESDGAVRARWHLSPASDTVADRVRAALAARGSREETGGERRVIVHQN